LTGAPTTGEPPPAPRAGDGSDPDPWDRQRVLRLLREGELTVTGRMLAASNTTLRASVTLEDARLDCVYKPVAGERPLWDFPEGTLANRELAAYLVSEATGWAIVPPTVIRDGPLGEGMCQLWVRAEQGVELVALHDADSEPQGWLGVVEGVTGDGREVRLDHRDDERLRRVAVFDAVVNNADRKGGHLLPTPDGRVAGIDHGVCFAVPTKLRTLLWGWAAEPLTEEARTVLRRLADALGDRPPDLSPGSALGSAPGELAGGLARLLTPAEVAAVRRRTARLLKTGVHPEPTGAWPAVPWPPV
jgi:uncharacterized repeat protein (TIGR03843 family)